MARSDSQSSQEDDLRGLGWLLGAIIAALIVGWFQVGPGADPPPDPDRPVKLVLAVPAEQESEAIYRQVIAKYEMQHPHVSVELRTITGSNYYQKLLVMLASGMPPDLMWMGMGFDEFASRGAFLDIGDRLERDINTSDFLPQVLRWYRRDGRQQGAPYRIDVQFIAYNKKLFDEAGVPYPQDDWDFDQFLSAARKLTVDKDGDGRIDQYGFYGMLQPSQFGAQFITDDGSRATCDTPQMIDYLQTSLDLYSRYKVAPLPQQVNGVGVDLHSIFRQDRAAMMVMYTWDLPFLRSQCADMDWDITLNPKIRRRAQWASSAAILVSSQTRHPDEAWALGRMFLSGDFMRRMCRHGGLPPSRSAARQMVAENDRKPANLEALIEAADFLVADPRIANYTELSRPFIDACDTVWMGYATPRQAMSRADRKINALIEVIRRRQGSSTN